MIDVGIVLKLVPEAADRTRVQREVTGNVFRVRTQRDLE